MAPHGRRRAVPSKEARARAIELLEQVGLGERLAPPSRRPVGRAAAARRHRPGARPRPAADPRRRAHRAPRLHPGRDRAADRARARVSGSRRRRRHPRRPDDPARRSGRRARAPFVAEWLGPQRGRARDGRHVLFEQGDRGDRIYVVEEGAIEVVRKRGDGTEELSRRSTVGDYFGEMGPLFGLPRSADAPGRTEPTVVTGYSVKDFRDKLGIERLGTSSAWPRRGCERHECERQTIPTRHRDGRGERVVAVLHVHGLALARRGSGSTSRCASGCGRSRVTPACSAPAERRAPRCRG